MLKNFRSQVGSKAALRHWLGCGLMAWRLAAESERDPAHRVLAQLLSGFFEALQRLSPSMLGLAAQR